MVAPDVQQVGSLQGDVFMPIDVQVLTLFARMATVECSVVHVLCVINNLIRSICKHSRANGVRRMRAWYEEHHDCFPNEIKN